MKKYAFLGFLTICFGLCGCHHSMEKQQADVQNHCLSDTMNQMIQVEAAQPESLENEIQLTGKVTFNEEKVLQVFPPAEGTASEVRVDLGDFVKKGQVLAVIQSGEIAGYQQDSVTAETNLQIAKKNLDAAQDLIKAGIYSEKDSLQAQSDYDQALAGRRKMDQIFRLYHIGQGAQYVITSPIDGFVVEKKLNPGMHIRSDYSDNLFTISNLDEVWVIADVYESDISKIQPGYEADVTTLSYEGKVFQGTVDKVSDMLDPDTKAMKIRIRLQNHGYLLKPEMFASIAVKYQEPRQLLAIPARAVVFDRNRNFVVVYVDSCHQYSQEVQIYRTVGDRTFLLGGLHPGDRVVSRYPLLIYQALNG